MKSQEIIGVVVTFTFAFFAGGYLYVNHFTPLVQPDNLDTKEELEQFTVVSQVYGSCQSYCPAFQVSHDGSYRYQYYPQVGAEPEVRSGTLPLSLRSELRKAMNSSTLVRQTTLVAGNVCASASDGIDISYTITLNGTTYKLDSCRSAVDFESDAWETLSEVWDYFSEQIE